MQHNYLLNGIVIILQSLHLSLSLTIKETLPWLIDYLSNLYLSLHEYLVWIHGVGRTCLQGV